MSGFLHKMAAYGDLAEVSAMLEDGHDPDERDEGGRTALMYAADGGHIAVMRALVEAGADVNAADEAGRTPLRYSIARGTPPVPKYLIEAGADVNAADEYDTTALHDAVERNYVYTVELLVAAGARAGKENDLGQSPLALAEETLERYRKIVRALKAAVRREQSKRSAVTEGQVKARRARSPKPKEIFPSSFLCVCGHQSDFSEGTVRALKAESQRKQVLLGDDGTPQHVIVFSKGKLETIRCPHAGRRTTPSRSSRGGPQASPRSTKPREG